MNAKARQASFVIDSVSKAIANWTVDQQAEQDPRLHTSYGQTWRSDWIAHTHSQLAMLAQSVSVRSKELFTASLRWTCQSFKSRGVSESDLLLNARCLRDVLSKELPPEIRSVAQDFMTAALECAGSISSDSEIDAIPPTADRKVVLQYVEAILEGDRGKAEGIIQTVFRSGRAVPAIYVDILAPALSELGSMWHRGEISVADEHFGSTTTEFVMAQLRPHLYKTEPNGLAMVATSTPGDFHEIGLRMVADLFESDGWLVYFLGASTPIADLVQLLERRKAGLLGLSVNTTLTVRSAGELIEAIRSHSAIAGIKILVGGPPFRQVPELWRELGADGYALTAVEAVERGNELVAKRVSNSH